MPEVRDLVQLVRSRVPLVFVESHEEKRALSILKSAAESLSRQMYVWSVTEGLSRFGETNPGNGSYKEPQELLQYIRNLKYPGIYALLDFHPFMDDPRLTRLIKDTAMSYGDNKQTLVFLSHQIKPPAELEYFSARFELKLPETERITELVLEEARAMSRRNQSRKIMVNREALDLLVKNLAGLSEGEVRRLALSAIEDFSIDSEDVPEISRAKYTLLNRDEVLHFEDHTEKFSEVGGLGKLKAWLDLREPAFKGTTNISARDLPRGCLLLGVQGGGKSLAAKAVAGSWGLPLLRLDFGTLFNKYYGETERKTREALRMAEAMAPCVLWIDEIEKGLAAGDNDGGTSRRLLGTLLTWMAERVAKVFLVATANDITALPSELLRKGRLDEIFFVDLPDGECRAQIFRIHLKRRNLDPADFDLPALVNASLGFSGAEIEQAIIASLYATAGDSGKLDQHTLVVELAATKPLSLIMSEKIQAMRQWASERTVPAH